MATSKEDREKRNAAREARKARKAEKAQRASGDGAGFINKIQKDLKLDADQLAKMKAVQAQGGDRAQIRKLLTKEQLGTLKAARAERKKARPADD